MKTREEAARFIEKQLALTHNCTREKGSKGHYGMQELRELMDFIYEGLPTEAQKLGWTK